MSKVIPQETLTAYERWELPLVGTPLPAAKEREEVVEEDEDHPHVPTAEEIAAIQEQAYQEAYEQGYAKGEQEGRAAGHKEGYDAGYAKGLAEGETEIRGKVEQLNALMATLDEPFANLDEQVEQQMVTLAIAMAKHLIRRELKTDPRAVVGAVRQAVSALPGGANNIRVFLHPEDATLVREALSVGNEDDGERRWKIVEEPVLTRGGCKVESEFSSATRIFFTMSASDA